MIRTALPFTLLFACLPTPPYAGASGDGPDVAKITVRVRTHEFRGKPVAGARVVFATADGTIVADTTANDEGVVEQPATQPLTVFAFEVSGVPLTRTIVTIPEVVPGQTIDIGNDDRNGDALFIMRDVELMDAPTGAAMIETVTHCDTTTTLPATPIKLREYAKCRLTRGDTVLVLVRSANNTVIGMSRAAVTDDSTITMPAIVPPQPLHLVVTNTDLPVRGSINVLFGSNAMTRVAYEASVSSGGIVDVPYAYGDSAMREVFVNRFDDHETNKYIYARAAAGDDATIRIDADHEPPWISAPEFTGTAYTWESETKGEAQLMVVTAYARRPAANIRWRYLVPARFGVATYVPPIVPVEIMPGVLEMAEEVNVSIDLVRVEGTVSFADLLSRADPAQDEPSIWFEHSISDVRLTRARSAMR